MKLFYIIIGCTPKGRHTEQEATEKLKFQLVNKKGV